MDVDDEPEVGRHRVQADGTAGAGRRQPDEPTRDVARVHGGDLLGADRPVHAFWSRRVAHDLRRDLDANAIGRPRRESVEVVARPSTVHPYVDGERAVLLDLRSRVKPELDLSLDREDRSELWKDARDPRARGDDHARVATPSVVALKDTAGRVRRPQAR